MSRKRKKAGSPDAEVTSDNLEAVPEDILAEGSGPVQAVAHVAIPTDDQEPDPPVRTKRKPKRSSRDANAELIETVADDIIADADAEAIAAAADATDSIDSMDSIEARATAAVERARNKRKKADIEPETIEADVAPDAQALAEAAERVTRPSRRRKAKVEDLTDDAPEAAELSADPEITANDVAPNASEQATTNNSSKRSKRRKRAADARDDAGDPADVDGELSAAERSGGSSSDNTHEASELSASVDGEASADGSLDGERRVDGEAVDGEHLADGASADGETIHGELLADGKTVDGELLADDDSADGEAVDGELLGDGASADGEAVDGELLADGASADGASADGEAVDGELLADGASADGASADGEIFGEASVDGEAAADGEGDVAATLPTSAAALEPEQLKQLVEALIFASDKPMTVQRLRQLTRVSDIPRLETALVELAADYADRGIVLQQVSGGYQFRTRTQWSPWVQQLIAGRPVRLTRAQLETLAIIAYRQPITRPEIDDIRGVDSSATLKLLIDRQLIRILGKKEEVGRPMLYGTTKEFLDFFSLGDLRELPTLREYSELTAESRQVITDRLGDLPEGEGGEAPSEMSADSAVSSDDASTPAPEPTAADLIARYVAEVDSDAAGDSSIGALLDRSEATTPEMLADDAATLADAILAMDPPTDALTTLGVIDSATPEADLASAALASDAEELADAILATATFEDLAFDLSDADSDDSSAFTEVIEGSLAEIDPFALALVADMGRDSHGAIHDDEPSIEPSIELSSVVDRDDDVDVASVTLDAQAESEIAGSDVAVVALAEALDAPGDVVEVAASDAASDSLDAAGDVVEAAGSDVVEAAGSDVVEAAGSDVVEAAGSDVVEAAAGDALDATGDIVEVAASDAVEAAGNDTVEAATDSLEAASDAEVEAAASDVVVAAASDTLETATDARDARAGSGDALEAGANDTDAVAEDAQSGSDPADPAGTDDAADPVE